MKIQIIKVIISNVRKLSYRQGQQIWIELGKFMKFGMGYSLLSMMCRLRDHHEVWSLKWKNIMFVNVVTMMGRGVIR